MSGVSAVAPDPGILVVRSAFPPRIPGFLLLVAGFGRLTTGVTSIVMPASSRVVARAAMPLLLGEFRIILWLLIKGAAMLAGAAPTLGGG